MGDAEEHDPDDIEVICLTEEEARQAFDATCRRVLGISGPEFLHRWDAGEMDRDDPRVFKLSMAREFGR